MEQRSARPTFEINGLTSGYQGEGSKTIVPAWARAKITCRLVPNQSPARIRKIVCDHLKKICPPTVRLEIEAGHGAEAYLVSPDQPAGAGGVARVAAGVQPRAGLVARRRLDPHCQRFQENPRRGLAAARPGLAGRQRPFAEREVRSGLLRKRPAHERAAVAGIKSNLKGGASRFTPFVGFAIMHAAKSYEERVLQTLKALGIPASFVTHRRRPLQSECEDLVSIGVDMFGREQQLERQTASHWQAMLESGKQEGVVSVAVSGFRSLEYQRKIIERKLAAGLTVEQIVRVNALPGFSEHHTGRAIDVGTPGCPPVTEEFEQSPAFDWLTRRGQDFGFKMSYPRGNDLGVIYEPWHWMFRGGAAS